MAYRTYRNLYRIRPSVSSIGQGRYRLRLPRGVQITADTVILAIVLWMPSWVIVGQLVSAWIPLPSWFLGVCAAGLIGYQLSKLDPAGKTVVAFLWDLAKYLTRPKVHDGWDARPSPKGRPEPVSWRAKVALVEDSRVGAFPARGVTQLELRVAANVRVKKGVVKVQHRGKRLVPRWYEVTEDGRVLAKRLTPKFCKSKS